MVEIGLLTWLGTQVLSFGKLKREDRLAAIDGLTPSVGATIAYSEKLNKTHIRDIAEEHALHNLWFSASSAVSRYDKELARVCREKARYWLKYDEYDDHMVEQLKIRLIDVANNLEDMKYE
ncbi:hypothetical protein CWM66_02235 [Kosakonia sp. H7A]|uniref:hypothetical protein n=1 Tax=Kosakonia sp. H7A TaxID=2054598 RepID=UPI000D152711|nr:hypothetical protein [Kosakonia sp. H7A]PTA92881.1 hypothetical protein CWM66_02235 [Kosakonia sp. H7A]